MNGRQRILIVGVGSIGERHLRCFASTGRADISFCEANAELRRIIAERYPASKAHTDFEQALAELPSAVLICTPAHLHVPMALRAAAIGAHLLIEKPLSTCLDAVEDLQRIVAGRGLIAAVAYVYRAHPSLAAMREAIRSGQFGAPLQIVCTAGQNFPYYRPDYRQTYYRNRATGGGAVQDALTHIINAGEWLVGPVDRLVADMEHKALAGVEVEDTAHVLTRHGGVMGCFSLNQHQAPNESTVTVNCVNGTARFEYHRSRWSWMTEPETTWHDEPAATLERDALFVRQAESFLGAIDGTTPVLCSLEEAVQSLRVSLAILASQERRSWLTVGEN